MAFFKSDTQKYQENLNEEFFFGSAAQEVSNGVISRGLYAKALSECQGNEVAAKARYLQLRVEQMQSELRARNEQPQALLNEQHQALLNEQKRIAELQAEGNHPRIGWFSRVLALVFGVIFLILPIAMIIKGEFAYQMLIAPILGAWLVSCGYKGKSLDNWLK